MNPATHATEGSVSAPVLYTAFRADERIDLVDLASQLRPDGFRGLARVVVGFSVGLVHFGTFVLRAARPA
jgi:hypothetical protein